MNYRVAILGNNLNQAVRLATILRVRGLQCKAFAYRDVPLQDTPEWWNEKGWEAVTIYEKHRPQAISFNPFRIFEFIKLLQHLRRFDIIIAREDFIGMLAFIKKPKLFWSQGADIQIRPFQLRFDWIDLKNKKINLFSLLIFISRLPIVIFRQLLQRRGIKNANALIIRPFQYDLAIKLKVSPSKIYYAPLETINFQTLDRPKKNQVVSLSPTEQTFCKLSKTYSTIIFHPTRILVNHNRVTPFCKDNDKLLIAYAKWIELYNPSAHLVLIRKGRDIDLDYIDQLILNLSIQKNITWLSQINANLLVNLIQKTKNIVIADQFSPTLATLGDIGRISVWAGVPLITSYDGVENVMYDGKPPNVYGGASSPEKILEQLSLTSSLTKRERLTLKKNCDIWFKKNLGVDAITNNLNSILADIYE